MRRLDIRSRMLLAALLPVAMVSVLLAVVFLLARFDDMQESYQQRTRSVARQLALASEYGLFSANQTQLQTVVRGALREPDVRWVAVLDGRGQILASAGDDAGAPTLAYGAQEAQAFDVQRHLDILVQPVFPTGIELDDLYEESTSRAGGLPVQLGQVVVKFSRQAVDARKQSMLLLGGLISLMGLIFGVMLAAGLSRGVIRPILRVTQMIARIGRGDFSAAVEVRAEAPKRGDPLHDLQQNLRRMAERLGHAREELEQQVALATQALREKKEEAELATQAKSRFLAAASHDLRQPIHALGMFVARLAQLSHDAPTRHLIGNLEASVRALQNLLDGLLDISRLEAQAIQIKLQKFPLRELLERLEQDLAPTALDKGLRLRIRPCPVWVQSDPVLLYRILLNLVGNALRYTEKGGVVVACRRTSAATQVSIEVWDSGLGIAPEHQESVFKEFFQVSNPARQRGQGMGLGLNIVQRSCQLLGHPLQLSSRLGVGTRMRLMVPVVVAQTDQVEVALAESTESQDWHGCAVLVIEDDELVCQALVGLLQSWGLEVAQARGLNDAQNLIQTGFVPGLIISDYRLDGATHGMDVIAQLRQQLAHPVPACLISADTDPALIRAAQAAQLTLLHKPVRPAKLRSLLRRLLIAQGVRGEARS
ncbi:MAG: hybrid sensor histidine kinase/response regulator [Betaproteobacteria bacterium HGW-Betaproteobacteria-18]|nr:MAG: hybrid sensor histidine kinase/response regulator [Betaproteobacteria bacterium HGW-Betaproteobacteria-18]